jgi:hypothetical protein
LHRVRRVEAVEENVVLQVVAHDRIAAFLLRLVQKAVGADGVQMATLHIHSETQNRVEFVGGLREVLRVALGVCHDDLALSDAANQETFARRRVGNSLWNKLRILEPKRDRRVRRLRLAILEFLPEGLKFRVVPD